jgi:hypothetical protein
MQDYYPVKSNFVDESRERNAVEQPDNAERFHNFRLDRVLHSVAESVNRLAEYLGEHPDEMGAATEAADSVGKQFGALVKAASEFDAGNARLKGMVGEMNTTADWVDCRFPQTERSQSRAMPLSGTFSGATLPVNNAFCGRIFNAVGTAPPVVGGFNELFGG